MTDAVSPFAHLRLHSEYDIQKGAARLSGNDSVVDYAAELQQPALALTDNGCLFGAIKFYLRCREKGIKPIIGCELNIDRTNDYYLLLLCASHTGYVNLNRLLTDFYREGKLHRSQLTKENTEGIIALSGGDRGDIGAAIRQGRSDAADKYARDWQQRFPDRFYLEVWRARQSDPYHSAAAALGARLGLPLAATHPVQCARAEDHEALNTKLCIAAGMRIVNPRRPQPLSDAPHLLTAEEMGERFRELPEALANSADIARRCNFTFTLGKVHLPALPQQDSLSAAERLQQEAVTGLENKLAAAALSPEQRQEYDARLQNEIGIINKMQYADYFLIVMDFIRWAKNEGIPVGPGRGSGAGSLVAYALDITTLDPLKYDLLFERFLNPERISLPDFDIDFCVNGRDRVIDYVGRHYGQDRVTQIVTFGTIGARSAVRDVGRVQGIAHGYCDRLARMIPGTPKITLREAMQQSEDFKEEASGEEGKPLVDLALKVEGLPRNIGTHAGGVLIAPRSLDEFCPTYAAEDTNTLVSQYDMGDIEKIGLVKFDFLGLRTLTILADAESTIRRAQPDFSLENLPLDDSATYDLYSSGKTIGVFQCESEGMRELMKQLRPDRFTDLIALVALYRPGPLGAGMDKSYIMRKHGKEEISYPHDRLQPVLKDTYGLFIYQEQVMEIARRMSGYSLSEADILRRAMGKKDEKQMAGMRARFVEGSSDTLSSGIAQKLFDDMAKFAEYGFNKSHAAAYALLSYRTAYIKQHYPAIFIAAVMSAEADNTYRITLLAQDIKRLGLTLAPPDINQSEGNFRAVDNTTIRFGLKAIKGIGGGVIEAITRARAAKPFTDLFDVCARTSSAVPVASLELLAQAGAFDSLHRNRAAVIATIPTALICDNTSGNLFAAASAADIADCAEWEMREKLKREHQAIGFPLSAEYSMLYQNILPRLPLTWRRLTEAEKGDSIVVAGHFRRISRRPGKKNGVFILYDDSGELEVLADREAMRQLTDSIKPDLLIIRGRAYQNFRNDIAIIADSITPLEDFLLNQLKHVTLIGEAPLAPAQLSARLPRSGRQQVVLQYQDEALSYQISLGNDFHLTHADYTRLTALPGIRRINLGF